MTMTPRQFSKAVRTIAAEDFDSRGIETDPEGTHGETDALMEQILIDLGYGAGIKEIRKMTRWYA